MTDVSLHDMFYYNHETGLVYHKVNKGKRKCKDTVAGSLHPSGYLYTSVYGKKFAIHRLAWFLYYGYFPNDIIDHINKDKTDNRINNLRDTNKKINRYNSKVGSNNITGTTGISKRGDRFSAFINIDNKYIHLGYFDNEHEAATARLLSEITFNY